MVPSELDVLVREKQQILCELAVQTIDAQCWVKWMKPASREIKLNTDGSRIGLAITAFWGVFGVDQGVWLGGFARNLGVASVLCAELHGIKHGFIIGLD